MAKYFKHKTTGQVFGYDDHQVFEIEQKSADAEFDELKDYPPKPTQAEQLTQWRSTATCESAKLKYVLADEYAILDDIEAVIAHQDGKVRSMWIFPNWSRNNQALIGMVTQMAQAVQEVQSVVDTAGGVDVFMDAWFKAGIELRI